MKNSNQSEEVTNERLTDREISIVYASCKRIGVRTTAEKLGVSKFSLSNAIAKLDITRGTLALIRQNIKELK